MYEVWRGDDFVTNQIRRPDEREELQGCAVHSLIRTSIADFEAAALAASVGALGHGGCVVVFRHEAPHVEPFGMWLLWLVVDGTLIIVDVQNSYVALTISHMVQQLEWKEQPRKEVFFASFK